MRTKTENYSKNVSGYQISQGAQVPPWPPSRLQQPPYRDQLEGGKTRAADEMGLAGDMLMNARISPIHGCGDR